MDDKARAVLQDVQDKGVKFIDLQFTDIFEQVNAYAQGAPIHMINPEGWTPSA